MYSCVVWQHVIGQDSGLMCSVAACDWPRQWFDVQLCSVAACGLMYSCVVWQHVIGQDSLMYSCVVWQNDSSSLSRSSSGVHFA